MATTYAMPPAPGRGGHGHSHSRKTATQRIPLQPTTMNGGYHLNASSVQMNSFKPYDMVQKDSATTVEAFPDLPPQQNQSSNLQLPKPPSFSSPNSARSKSMERRKSVGLPTHLNLQGNSYGFHTAGVQKFKAQAMETEGSWISSKEMISAVIVPLPYALASLVFESGIRPLPSNTHLPRISSSEPLLEDDKHKTSVLVASSSFSLVCGLTAMTLALSGLRGKLAQALRNADSGGTILFTGGLKDVGSMQLGRRIAGRVLLAGLPFYAASQLGGARVAVVLLIALASNLSAVEEHGKELLTWRGWKQLATHRTWTMLSLALQPMFDLLGLTSDLSPLDICLGYLALGLIVFVFSPPYPSSRPNASIICSQKTNPESSRWVNSSHTEIHTLISPLVCTTEDTDLTLATAVLMGIFGYLMSYTSGSSAGATSGRQIAWSILSAISASLALMFTDTKALGSGRGFGSVLGSFASCFSVMIVHQDIPIAFLYQSILISVSFVAMFIDSRKAFSTSSHLTQHHHRHHGKSHVGEIAGASRFTNYVLHWVQDWPLLHTILIEKDSRRIFYFMCLNFAFMLVQTFYGIVSGSLGLLSDSIHMFFDCLALLVGLSAAVMSKWPPSTRFPYGYAKIETLAGFANGVFLMLISIEIIYEALERLSVGSNVKRLNELMTVSILGFLINVIGILAFGHAHHGHDHSHGHSHNHNDHDDGGHSHGDHEHTHNHSHHTHSHHDHDHDHEHAHAHNDETHCQDHVHHENLKPKSYPPNLNGHTHHVPDNLQIPTPSPSIYSSVPATPSKPIARSHEHNHSSHGHHDHHHSENMMGIYLHVLGDTLGSAAVVLSTWLVQLNGWSGWDPLASTGIAIIIFGTAIPLVKNCARKLLLTVPEDTEYDLREALAGVSGLRGVVGCAVPKFWIQEGEQRRVMGVVHVMADRVSNLEEVKERCIAYLKGTGLDVLVQVERDGVGRCWCQAAK